MNERSERRGLIEVLCAMSIAGSTVVVGKLLSVRIPVFLAMELSLVAALVAILPAQIVHRRELRLLKGRELAYMFLQAFFGIVLFRALTLYGLRLTSAINAGVITSAAPAVMAVLAAVALRERIGTAGIAGVLLSVTGLLLVNLWGWSASTGAGYLAGNLLVLGAMLCEAPHRVSKVLGRPHRVGHQYDGARRHERSDDVSLRAEGPAWFQPGPHRAGWLGIGDLLRRGGNERRLCPVGTGCASHFGDHDGAGDGRAPGDGHRAFSARAR